MSAQVDQMFSVREMPWHRQGHVLDDYPQSWDEARVLAGLDWEPVDQPLYALDGVDAETGREIYAEVKGFRRVVRSDTHATLACVTDVYQIINHSAFGEIFEAVLQQDNVRAETGGCLAGGTRVWMLVKLDEPVVIPGDSTATVPYAALTARHDAKGGVVLRATAVRIVCANTFRAAELEGERTGLTYSFSHRGDWRSRLGDARESIMGIRKELRDYVTLSTSLMGVKVTGPQTEMFVRAFVPEPPTGLITPRVTRNIEQARAKMREILASETIDGAGISGTAYGLVQAGGEYLDHVRACQSWESKIGRTLIRPEPLKARAMKMALECANA